MTDITEEHLGKLERLYNGTIPEYMGIQSTELITIRAAMYEGAPVEEVRLTPRDVVQYYLRDDEVGARGFSGCRTLGSFTTDWRMVDNMAREAMEVFKVLDREGLMKAAEAYGDELHRQDRGRR